MFGRLPPELRAMIYDLRLRDDNDGWHSHRAALLRLSKSLNSEFEPLLHKLDLTRCILAVSDTSTKFHIRKLVYNLSAYGPQNNFQKLPLKLVPLQHIPHLNLNFRNTCRKHLGRTKSRWNFAGTKKPWSTLPILERVDVVQYRSDVPSRHFETLEPSKTSARFETLLTDIIRLTRIRVLFLVTWSTIFRQLGTNQDSGIYGRQARSMNKSPRHFS